jgi:hypothetical protein
MSSACNPSRKMRTRCSGGGVTVHSSRRQRGVVLIVILMVAVTASAFVILRTLNAQPARETAQRLSTVEALAQARRALLGYAVDYVGGAVGQKGPGRLPCPDHAGGSPQGVAESFGYCRAANNRETGLLPFRTLGLTDLRDGSGAPLWYAVAERYNSMADGPLNSATPAALKVDTTDEVVAVIIAPGAQLPGQVRSSGSSYTASAWLESENASLGDNRFTRSISSTINDTVVTITRAELMTQVQKVVTKEVANALREYREDPDGDDVAKVDPECAPSAPKCDDGLPWLAPRTASTDAGEVDTGVDELARVPLLELGQPIAAEFVAQWRIVNSGTIERSGAEEPEAACLRRNTCTQNYQYLPGNIGPGFGTTALFAGPVLGQPSPPWAQGTCTLHRDTTSPYRLNVSCTTSYDFTASGRTLRRVYLFEFNGNNSLFAPSDTTRRTVAVRAFGSWASGTSGTITLTDFEGGTVIGTGKLSFSSLGPTDSVVLLNVPFDLEVPSSAPSKYPPISPGALPRWFLADAWQQSIFVQYAASQAPGYVGPVCQGPTSCLTLRLWRPGDESAKDIGGLRGVVVAAGPPLPATASPARPAQTRPSGALHDYLEGINTIEPTTLFESRDSSSSFNDQILELELAP